MLIITLYFPFKNLYFPSTNTEWKKLKYIGNVLVFTEVTDLKRKFMLFGYFWQDNCKIAYLARQLGARLQIQYFIAFHLNSLVS